MRSLKKSVQQVLRKKVDVKNATPDVAETPPNQVRPTPGGKTPPLQKRRPFASKRSWLGGFEGSVREFKHTVGEYLTREGDQELQVE